MAKRIKVLSCVFAVSLIALLSGATASWSAPAVPTGELKAAMSSLGNEQPVPWLEIGIGKNYMRLLYDPLVGSSDDGVMSTETGIAKK